MQKGYFFFLILMLASAVILGSTIGLISNVSYMVQHTDLLKTQSSEPSSEGNINDATIPLVPQPAGDASSQDLNQSNKNSGSSFATSSSSSSEYMVISQEEKEQIKRMLFSLGMDEKDDLNQFVREFQKNNALEATGTLDSQTLDAIIKQTTLQEVSRSLNRGINV
ncbi:MAG: peptidoglycan-binding domain-containing protein [Syntrophomonas sp.]|uniref:peptidoglycan-binding domain-containing protein n=1 Tax=Syntrophomonas sp. TaxID=2053627 RepID=UPI00262A104A|nr:peptidoglycan-binding domain-containing protein [Syntrophomonas sp.]MDD2509895.1 peptidoglycan-binding domain-containing protein [Syntrophomonas sp.]MDD3879632.1 peptidoglycan-binding domain-containing protein [Syntrophomonas sp.]MDD4626187.1 peptidoglycan-binding domain-containing protein [Syntrophomonas sp.]